MFRRKDITDPISGSLYLQRWHLVRLFGLALMLHKMHRPDYSLCDHDHPWWFISLVLRGGYEELVDGEHRRHRPGALLFRGRHFRHHITRLPRGTAWTLVLRGRHTRTWGFWKDVRDGVREWRAWTKYNTDWCGGR